MHLKLLYLNDLVQILHVKAMKTKLTNDH